MAAVAVLCLSAMVVEGKNGDGLEVDALVIDMMQAVKSPLLTGVFRGISYSASTGAMAGMVLILCWRWYRQGRRSDAALLLTTVAGGAILGLVLKSLLSRPRPEGAVWLTWATGWSYPSGHTLSAVTFAGLLAYLTSKGRTGWRVLITWLTAGFWAACVGVSRVYLGVHYPSDVLASVALGALVLLVGAAVSRVLTRYSGQTGI